jgi:hypothetical protein
MYGFHKQRQHLNHHHFAHEQFKRGVLESSQISRVQVDIKRKPERKKKVEEKVRDGEGEKEHYGSQEGMSEESQEQQNSVSIAVDEEHTAKNKNS